ncbi:MAG: terpene cyclase/mutase family protein [Defluviitaleaceae bacterium]|nr:terpene cyclase/mutase family protein [Defluviitaleaceae bacterium]MCL2262095.1 terpene cyclase/mutase family protein [Defluviitaleaceae bacterium]
MQRIFKSTAIFILVCVLLSNAAPVFAACPAENLDRAIGRTASYLQRAVWAPQVGSVGGEWTVFGLARSARRVPALYFRRYLWAVEAHLRANGGVLSESRFTEYSRVILALTAAGFDPRNVAGVDLTLPLGDFERTVRQGVNGAVFALLALDSAGYEIPANPNATTQATREMFVAEILRLQFEDGGWGFAGEVSDIDITGMALQALAKYLENESVYAAVERALDFLAESQNQDGGWGQNESVLESSVQVLVAFAELGIPLNYPRFVQNGNTVLDSVLGFQNSDGSFRREINFAEGNLMSTEIAFYGLVAAQRSANGKSSLYRMG